jgi:hypothetical protein
MKSLFDPVIEEVTNLVGQQVKEAKDKHSAIIDANAPHSFFCASKHPTETF